MQRVVNSIKTKTSDVWLFTVAFNGNFCAIYYALLLNIAQKSSKRTYTNYFISLTSNRAWFHTILVI